MKKIANFVTALGVISAALYTLPTYAATAAQIQSAITTGSAAALAGGTTTGGTTTPKGTYIPPIVNEASKAYSFRTQLSGNPECQRFATESDAIFLDSNKTPEEKAPLLKQLKAQAAALGCITN